MIPSGIGPVGGIEEIASHPLRIGVYQMSTSLLQGTVYNCLKYQDMVISKRLDRTNVSKCEKPKEKDEVYTIPRLKRFFTFASQRDRSTVSTGRK